MAALTIELSDEQLRQLKEKSDRLGVAPEELVRISIADLLAKSDEAFQRAAEYVLKKNAELYRRLA